MAARKNSALSDPRVTFTLAAINACKRVNAEDGHPERTGMHVVYSGYNAEFERRFGEQSRTVTDAMVTAGMISIRGARGGPMLYLAADAPAVKASDKVKNALAAL